MTPQPNTTPASGETPRTELPEHIIAYAERQQPFTDDGLVMIALAADIRMQRRELTAARARAESAEKERDELAVHANRSLDAQRTAEENLFRKILLIKIREDQLTLATQQSAAAEKRCAELEKVVFQVAALMQFGTNVIRIPSKLADQLKSLAALSASTQQGEGGK